MNRLSTLLPLLVICVVGCFEDLSPEPTPDPLVDCPAESGCRLTAWEIDTDVDGVTDRVGEYTYDAERNLVAYEQRDADGTITRQDVYTYDQAGNRVREERRRGTDLLSIGVTVFEYDALGNLLIEREDDDNDGLMELQTEYTYNSLDAVLSEYIDYKANGVVDEWYEWTYDAAGFVAVKTWGQSLGNVEGSWTYQYDANGDNVLEELDDSGGVFRKWVRAFDARHNMLTEEDWREVDHEGGGSIFTLQTFAYDGACNLVRWENFDAVTDTTRYVRIWGYDGVGNLISQDTDTGGDGVLDSQRTSSFECD